MAESSTAESSPPRARWKVWVGWAVVIVAVAAFPWGLWHQIDIGDCGGPAQPECPPASNVYIPAMLGGVAAALVGGGLVGTRAAGWLLLLVATPVMLALKAFTDREPGARGGLLLGAGVLVLLIVVGIVVVVRLARQGMSEQKLKDTGAKARGEVLGVRSTGLEVNHDPQAELRLRLTPLDGSEPFEVADKRIVNRLRPPRVGDLVPAWFDPADHTSWTMTLPGPEGLAPELVAEFGLASTAAGAAVDEDVVRVEALQKLVTLRDSGGLTADEFEREKQRLLE